MAKKKRKRVLLEANYPDGVHRIFETNGDFEWTGFINPFTRKEVYKIIKVM